ncbi:MAG: PTS system mannose/fructose/sorbose family transporter subunit IID [Gemmatimonadota bacterium]|nr:PTS system mannose/fructose/sorbose family transporter subunit IID [Gemmatimonadota bacterium]
MTTDPATLATAPAPAQQTASLPPHVFLTMFARLLAIQGSWNYELLLGTGIGFCTEPALRRLPGGKGGPAYRQALARQSRYFNAHPYLAAVAVGALARVEIDEVQPVQIERFRTALCGPLGSVGDQLVWAGWLPFSSLLALLAFGLEASPVAVLLIFLGVYNVGHLGLRAWGLLVGWRRGMRVASALANPVMRRGPLHIARVNALVAGIALPLSLARVLDPGKALPALFDLFSGHRPLGGLLKVRLALAVPVTLLAALMGAAVLVSGHGRFEGWRAALLLLGLFALYSVVRS